MTLVFKAPCEREKLSSKFWMFYSRLVSIRCTVQTNNKTVWRVNFTRTDYEPWLFVNGCQTTNKLIKISNFWHSHVDNAVRIGNSTFCVTTSCFTFEWMPIFLYYFISVLSVNSCYELNCFCFIYCLKKKWKKRRKKETKAWASD